jgi:hypothetical protein
VIGGLRRDQAHHHPLAERTKRVGQGRQFGRMLGIEDATDFFLVLADPARANSLLLIPAAAKDSSIAKLRAIVRDVEVGQAK